MMRAARALLLLIGTTLPAPSSALANDGFSVVVPGRAGVPVVINGVDASWAVVESDWGLAKNVQLQPTVYGGRRLDSAAQVGHYYPSAGHTPGYGRLEVQPPANRKLPKAAESFHQSWSAQSTPQPEVPYDPPPVMEGSSSGGLPQAGGALPQDFHNPPHDFRHRNHRKLHH